MRALKALILSLVLTCFCFAEPPQWYHCKVVSQDLDPSSAGPSAAGAVAMPISTAVHANPVYHTSNIVQIETSIARYTILEELKGLSPKPIVFVVNASARFYHDANYLVFPDANGKKHRFTIMHIEKLLPQ